VHDNNKEGTDMANQYAGSFEHKIKQKFDCSAKELLEKFARENLSYNEVEKRLGFTHGTIRKWARRYGICLKSSEESANLNEKTQRFLDASLNAHNFLSRKWQSHL
jgi:hypothetical protein